jgi:hypothetical protein
LILGYAIGTGQILGLEWVRDRRAHSRALRLLRAEILRLQGFDLQFGWSRATPPASQNIPKPPSVTSVFLSTIASLDWRLTDEHQEDDSAVAMMIIADLCDTMQRYHRIIEIFLDKADAAEDARVAATALDDAIEVAEKYDKEVNQFLFVLDSALKDVDGRLQRCNLWRQLARLVIPLPLGKNEPPVSPDDPRVAAFIERRRLRHVAPGA